MNRLIVLPLLVLSSSTVLALPSERDRVYTADQNSNTVSVIDPASNTLLGQIRLGNPRPDILSSGLAILPVGVGVISLGWRSRFAP